MEQGLIIKKIIKMKDIIRLFFKYDVEFIPVLDKKNKFVGLIKKDLLIQDATEGEFIERPFMKFIDKYLSYPNEETFLTFVTNLSENCKFPVIDRKGEFLFLWDKKKLLNSYYNISVKEKEEDPADDMFYKEILNHLPFDIVLTDIKNKILFANKSFIKNFDFQQDILIDNNINKFFPTINMVLSSQNFYPKVHSITYRHLKWYYTVLKFRMTCIYIFSLMEERLKIHGKDYLFLSDNSENKVTEKKNKINQKEPKNNSLPDVIKNKETDIIKKVLQDNEWNISKAANILKIPRQTLQYKISKYKLI